MRTIIEIFTVFLRLGLVAFGGPVAHLGYFRRVFVEQRRWLDDAAYAQILALCHLLPGPSSSQVGFTLGIQRAGIAGGIAAWLGFTLPSALLMIGLGIGLHQFSEADIADWVHGLKLAAIAVVAHAVFAMARQLCPDRTRAGIALASAMTATLLPGTVTQVTLMAVAGLIACAALPQPSVPTATLNIALSRRIGVMALGLFALGLLALQFAWPGVEPLWAVLYQSAALVFGGGHVMLPLLEAGIVGPGLLDSERFIAGYGAAQAIPGPLFTFAGFLGAQVYPAQAAWAGLGAVLIVFLPGLLLVVGLLPFWTQLSQSSRMQQALSGVSAAVVGLLGAVLWNPLMLEGVQSVADGLIAAAALLALTALRWPVYWVVAGCLLVTLVPIPWPI